MVTADRLIRAIGLVDRLGGLDDPAGFADLVLPALAELVGGDVLTCAEVDLATGALCRAGFPDGVIPPARHRLAITLVEPGQAVVCLAVHRSRPGFTAADRELLDVLRGPLLTGLSRARARAGRPVGNARLGELTDGEMRVLDLTALGRTNDAIAHALGISPRTVAKHLEHVYRKLGVANRAAAVARFTTIAPSTAGTIARV